MKKISLLIQLTEEKTSQLAGSSQVHQVLFSTDSIIAIVFQLTKYLFIPLYRGTCECI